MKIKIPSPLLFLILIFMFNACSKQNDRKHKEVNSEVPDLNKVENSGITPSVFWVSDPVQPGEVVMLAGANFGNSPGIELSLLKDKRPGPAGKGTTSFKKTIKIKPLQLTTSSVKFLVPPDWKHGVYSLEISSGNSRSVPLLVNAPEPWWQQGDWGNEASPGGWLRIFGKCLSLNGKAAVSLRRGEEVLILMPGKQDLWSLSIDLPAKMMSGEYETWLHNGCGGPAGWKQVGAVIIKEHPPLWKENIFDIREFGATGNDEYDDGAAIQSALDAAGRNGGGIVFIPRGLFQVNNTLLIPRFVLLKGDGADRTRIYWRDRVVPLDALIRGTNSFGIEDITITAINHMAAIMSDPGTEPDAGNVFLRRLNIRLNRFGQVKVHWAAERIGSNWQSVDRRLSAIAIDGTNIQVTDCNISSSHSPFRLNGNYGLFNNNQFFQGGTSPFISGTQVIFENNTLEGGPVARGTGCYVRQNLYYAYNEIGNLEFEDAELFTSDGHHGKREVTFVSVSGTKVTLAEDVDWKELTGPIWTGNTSHEIVLSIVGGTGYGQYRFINGFNGHEIEIERPWDVTPDSTSLISLSRCFKRNLLIGNSFHDGAIVQSYCMGIDWIMAGNKISRSGGIHNIGHGISPSWFNQYLNNEILVGGGLESPPRDSHLGVFGGVGARFTVFRRNILQNNARIGTLQNRWGVRSGSTSDVVIDHNIIRDTELGINVAGKNNGVLLWGNRFEGVKEPIVGLSDGVFMHPAERLLNMLSAAGLIPENLNASPEWQSAWKCMEKLQADYPITDDLPDKVRICQSEMIAAAAKALPGGITMSLLQAITGISFQEKSSSELHNLLAGGTEGEAITSITTFIPEWSLPLKVSLSIPPITGWQASSPDPMEIQPGESATSVIKLNIPENVWGNSTVPLNCKIEGPDWQLIGSGTIRLVSSNQVSQWMVAGPFVSEETVEWPPASFNAIHESFYDTTYPSDHIKNINVNATFNIGRGKTQWQPVTTSKIDFNNLYGSVKNGIAYAMTVIRVASPARVAISTSIPAAMIFLDGEIMGLPYHRWGHDMISCTLPAGDHILLCSVPNTFNSRTGNYNSWEFSLVVEVDPENIPGDVSIVPVNQIKKVKNLTRSAIP